MTSYLDNVIAEIPLIDNCVDLNAKLSKVTADVNELQTKIGTQIAKLAPLLTPPHDLPSTITWCTAMVQNYVLPHTNLLAQQAELTSKLAEVTAKVQQRASELGCS